MNARAELEVVIDYTATRSHGGKPVSNDSLQSAVSADLRGSKIIQLWLGGPQPGRLDVAQSHYRYIQ
jgi:hypothetical protein